MDALSSALVALERCLRTVAHDCELRYHQRGHTLDRLSGKIVADATASVQPERLTVQQAANPLNVTRHYLERLLEEEQLPTAETGDGSRILLADALAFKQERAVRCSEGLRELTHLIEELGGYCELWASQAIEDRIRR